jgi:hypothetical protein
LELLWKKSERCKKEIRAIFAYRDGKLQNFCCTLRPPHITRTATGSKRFGLDSAMHELKDWRLTTTAYILV